MRPPHSPASRLAVLATLGTAVLLVEQTSRADAGSTLVVIVAILVLLVAGALKLWFHNCFESRVAVALGLTAALVGTLLSLTIGLPTADRQEVTAWSVGLVVLPVVALALLLVDARGRRQQAGRSGRSPYAL